MANRPPLSESSSSSTSFATVRVSSPLNPSSTSSPNSTPTRVPATLPPFTNNTNNGGNSSSNGSNNNSGTVTLPLADVQRLSPPGSPTARPGPAVRPRGYSTSTIKSPQAQGFAADAQQDDLALSRATSHPVLPTSSPSLSPKPFASTKLRNRSGSNSGSGSGSGPGSRSRSRSPAAIWRAATGHSGNIEGSEHDTGKGAQTPLLGMSSSWWGRVEPKEPANKWSATPEQGLEYMNTRERVAKAASSVLGTSASIAHELLSLSADALQFAPVVGLSEAAKTLLSIWDALQLVDMNRLACLRLTSRCADILLSVREEVAEAGDAVMEELKDPVRRLEDSFLQTHAFLLKQAHRPFLKRYLKRDEILKQIAGCDKALGDALGMFGLSIQIRILKQVQAAEARRQAETQELIRAVLDSRVSPPMPSIGAATDTPRGSLLFSPSPPLPSTSTASQLYTLANAPNTSGILSTISTSPSQITNPAQITQTLTALHARQNALDNAADTADLRRLMRTALAKGSDVEMMRVLDVGREEMPEAIKTLQRALERVGESEVVGEPAKVASVASAGGVGLGLGLEEAPVLVKRSGTMVSKESGESDESVEVVRPKDTLDREFIESGIDALRRMSRGSQTSLPSWTITRYEVDREQKIGIGFFSDVYRGTWRGRTVAIKVLAPSTPRKLFQQEVEIWKSLEHRHVLGLYGASSASGDPPWFFVSVFCERGSLVEYLRGVASGKANGAAKAANGGGNGNGIGKGKGKGKGKSSGSQDGGVGEVDMLRMMHEIAKGMEYLHGKGVLHGDLKAANVLVDDRERCVIADFGQSEMKNEVYRISGKAPPHGTLRWQSPELMEGAQPLTTQMDVYAFAICCTEILTMGRLPWPLQDDDAVRRFVLQQNMRPPLPLTHASTPALRQLLDQCWDRNPFNRPAFSQVVADLKKIRKGGNGDGAETPLSPPPAKLDPEERVNKQSPDLRPGPLPFVGNDGLPMDLPETHGISVETGETPESEVSVSSPTRGSYLPSTIRRRTLPVTGGIETRVPVLYTPSAPHSPVSSLFESTIHSNDSTDTEDADNPAMAVAELPLYTGYDSPPPEDQRVAEMNDERRYRLLLEHEFHASLTLPLWTPVPVSIGAVGYLSKPSGTFVTLFNSLDPPKPPTSFSINLPSVHGYGAVTQGSQRQDKRNVAQRGFDAISGLLTFRKSGGDVSRPVSRRYSFHLRKGHRAAYLATETTSYRYLENFDAPKQWFKANVDNILLMYGAQHGIQREDVFMVIGTLDAPDYAMFVSHKHPEGQAHFNVFSGPKAGQSWGTFTTDNHTRPEQGGPVYEEEDSDRVCASKVSIVGHGWDTLIIAKLRFKTDGVEPTSL